MLFFGAVAAGLYYYFSGSFTPSLDRDPAEQPLEQPLPDRDPEPVAEEDFNHDTENEPDPGWWWEVT